MQRLMVVDVVHTSCPIDHLHNLSEMARCFLLLLVGRVVMVCGTGFFQTIHQRCCFFYIAVCLPVTLGIVSSPALQQKNTPISFDVEGRKELNEHYSNAMECLLHNDTLLIYAFLECHVFY